MAVSFSSIISKATVISFSILIFLQYFKSDGNIVFNMYVSSIFSAPKYLFCAKKTKISKATVIPLQNKIFWCVCLNCNKITTPSRDYKPSMGIVNQRLAENMVCSVSLFFPCLLRYHAPILSNGKVVAKIKQMEYFVIFFHVWLFLFPWIHR